MDDKKKPVGGMIFTFVIGLVVLCTIVAFSYSFFTGNFLANINLNVISNIVKFKSAFTAQTTGNIYLEVLDGGVSNVDGDLNNNIVARANQSISVVFVGSDSKCTYDIIWTDTSVIPYVPSAGVTENSLFEYTLKIIDNDNNIILPETQVDSYTSGEAIIKNESISSTGTEVEKTYIATATIYDLHKAQTVNGKTFTGMINVANVVC